MCWYFQTDFSISETTILYLMNTKNIIISKINAGQYSFEKINCAICNGKSFENIAKKERHGFDISVVICVECGLIQTNPRMTQESYDMFYQNIYSDLTRLMGLDYYFQRQIIRGKEIEKYYSIITNNILKNKKILDVGCGAGGVVKYLSDIGNDVSGFDLDERYIEYGKQQGANIKVSKIEDISDQQFDLIIYRHTFEHILQPLQELEKIMKLCSNDTLVYLEVPGIKNMDNYNQNFKKYLTIAHTYHYTLTTLKNMILKAGFVCVSGNEVINMLIKKGYSNSAVINDFSKTKSYLKQLKFRKSYNRKLFEYFMIVSKYLGLNPIGRIVYRKFSSKYK